MSSMATSAAWVRVLRCRSSVRVGSSLTSPAWRSVLACFRHVLGEPRWPLYRYAPRPPPAHPDGTDASGRPLVSLIEQRLPIVHAFGRGNTGLEPTADNLPIEYISAK